MRKIGVVDGNTLGIVVSSDEKWMAVTSLANRNITVYKVDDGTVVRTIGSYGSGPAQFRDPVKLCFVAGSNNLLVCDYSNDRVQELTLEGGFVRAIAVETWPYSVATNGELIVVGKYTSGAGNKVVVFRYGSGEKVREFAADGPRAGEVDFACGIRFTPDNRHIIVVEWDNKRLSMFTVEGAFVKHIGVRLLVGIAPFASVLVAKSLWLMRMVIACIFSHQTAAR